MAQIKKKTLKEKLSLPKGWLEDLFYKQLERSGLPLPTRSYRFHPSRKWEFDLAYLDLKIAIEVEGGIWRRGGGAHSSGKAIIRDIEKYNEAGLMGWRVFRVHTEMILIGSREMDDGVELVRQVLDNLPMYREFYRNGKEIPPEPGWSEG